MITPHTAIGETFAGDPRTAVDAAIPAREVEEIRRAANPHRTIPVLQGADEVFTVGTTFGENFTVFDQSAVGFIIFGMAFGIGTSIAAGFYPAWSASQLAPVDAMRKKSTTPG